ncbi:UDP-glucose 4-epimerase [Caldanaerobius fijiensis DSM 17918]|uniref:UDP-glucose 4-epimerase n=1 Tax=Caldanaerobius fijiensis DSM 17918 TaxID=1121256 RepID=A0A1M5CB11_9THEO|nr:SDR family oxidoreductase [Caldanaerobius fijiensis]SHF51777.1 UDP-glucose 4-epimerase [Caldanaerobius fijiensis DSM 17918]
MAKYLITGGAGFIGSNIAEELLKRGEYVRIIDNFSTGKRENIEEFIDDIDLIEGDLRNIDDVKEAVKDIDFVLHQAALPSVPRSVADPISSNANNIDGTLNLLVAAKEAGVKRVVIAASSSAYGDTEILPKSEDMMPNPLSPYAVTKYVEELYGRVFYKVYGLETVSLRYFNVFGPKQDPNSQYAAVIPKFITKILKGEFPVIFGDGEQTRDFTYVDNVVEANILAATSDKVGHGEVINIACGQRISLNQLVDKINEILGTNIRPIYDKPRVGDVKHSLASIEKAEKLLGYSVKVTFEEGLRKVIDWYKMR